MTRDEWKSFWDGVELYCHDYGVKLLLKFERGKDIVLVIPKDDSEEDWSWPENGWIVEEAKFGLRDGNDPTKYIEMLRVTKTAVQDPPECGKAPIPSKVVHGQNDPETIFSILYAP